MTVTNLALIGVAVVAIFGAAGAFAVAFRRSQCGRESRSARRGLVGDSGRRPLDPPPF